MGPLELYKSFVRQHSALVYNLERLAHWAAWSPDRFNGSEFAYEAFNAAVGLLGLYNESIVAGDEASGDQTDWAFALAAVEQVQTLVELRAIQMEQRGKMSRYGPLIALEVLKLAMRLRMWGACRSHLALECVSKEDQELYDSEQRLRSLLGAFVRLRRRFDPADGAPPEGGGCGGGGREGAEAGGGCAEGVCGSCGGGWYAGAAAATGEAGGDPALGAAGLSAEEQERARAEYNARQAAAAAVRAAAIAPGRPPCACGSSGAAVGAARGSLMPGVAPSLSAGSLGQQQGYEGGAAAAGSSGAGLAGAGMASGSTSYFTAHDASSAGDRDSEGASATGDAPAASDAGAGAGPSKAAVALRPGGSPRVHSPFRWGWWGSSARTPVGEEEGPAGNAAEEFAVGAASSSGGGGYPGSLPGSWGPPQRPPPREPRASAGAWPWPWARLAGRSAAGGGGGSAGGGGGCGRLEQKLLERQSGWRLDPAGMDVGDKVIWLGELVYLLRPLIYVIMLKRHGLRSWRPWAASLGVELLSQYMLGTGSTLLRASGDKRWPAGSTLYSLALLRGLTARRWGPTEQQELLARRLGLLRYLLRSPCYDAVTRPAVSRGVRAVQWLPLFGSLGTYALELVDSMQGYYTYVES